MAVAIRPDRSVIRRVIFNSLRRELLSWEFLLFTVLIFSQHYWVLPLTYLFLSSYLVAPSGIIPWIAILGLPIICVATLFIFFMRVAKYKRARRQVQAIDSTGVFLGPDEFDGLKLPRPRRFFLILVLLPVVVAPIVSVTVWNEVQGRSLISVNGKVVAVTDREKLVRTLSIMRRDGLFRRFP